MFYLGYLLTTIELKKPEKHTYYEMAVRWHKFGQLEQRNENRIILPNGFSWFF